MLGDATPGGAPAALDFLVNSFGSSTRYSLVGKDLEGGIQLWNEGARRLYGYEAVEMVGRANFSILYVPEDVRAGKHREVMASALRDGKWEGVLAHIRKDGSRFAARLAMAPRRLPDGRPVGFLAVSNEIEGEIHLDGQFLADLPHIAAIPKVAGSQRFEQALPLLGDLLELAKIEAGRPELRFEPVHCQAVLDELAAALRPQAEAKKLALEVIVPAAKVVIQADRRALGRILFHLISNAIKFTEAGGVRIELRRWMRGDIRKIWTEFSVEDTGSGIQPVDQLQLFQAFKPLDGSGARRSEGAGLGLYLSQRLAVLLGGRIEIMSNYGYGSIFRLMIPEK
jgi:PAS domain S-box-containing protein